MPTRTTSFPTHRKFQSCDGSVARRCETRTRASRCRRERRSRAGCSTDGWTRVTNADDLLDALDPEQRAIAEVLRGPVSVLAGAGTVKTRAITHRIAYGVLSGVYAPQRVLAVTFTRKAAGELQGRLRALGAAGVRAQTFHGAALAQLSHFCPQLVGGAASQVLPGKVATVAQAAEGMGLRLGSEALRAVATEIEWPKVSMLSLDAYAAEVEERAIPMGLSAEQLVEVQRRYTELLGERQ